MTQEMLLIRSKFPKLRRTEPTAIIHSGGNQTIYDCLCGSRHTTSTNWNGRNAKHVKDWKNEHADCDKIIAKKLNLK